MFFAKPRLSAAVINCADCSASLMSGSGRFVTSAPTSRLVVRARISDRCLYIGASLFDPSCARARDRTVNRAFSLNIFN